MAPVDFEIWLNHFEHHARCPSCVPPGKLSRLTPGDRRHVAGWIGTFQRGEQSAGPMLLKAAQAFAGTRDTPALVRIVELLVLEEARHTALLLTYIQENHIATRQAGAGWTDRLFCRLRRLGGLELQLQLLISAKLIRIVYYRALEKATTCPRLTVLCRILVSDELAHVGFASQLLLSLRAARRWPVRWLMCLADRASLAGTAGIVWMTHRALLRGARYGLRDFLLACLSQYAFYLAPVNARQKSNRFPLQG